MQTPVNRQRPRLRIASRGKLCYPIQTRVSYCAGFFISATKFTVGKSKVMVFTARKRRDRWAELDTLGKKSPLPQQMCR